jgi:predicted metal-binding protein
MIDRAKLEAMFKRHGYDDFKWIDPREIVVAQWVRMKCTFGCWLYGRNASCPPNTPSVAECREFFDDYATGAVFHFEKTLENPEDRHAWSREINRKLLKLEREVFMGGHRKAYLLFMDSCGLCAECSAEREKCKQPKLARPTPEALAMDVFATVRQYGYPIEVLSDYGQTMNRYSFLLIE